MGLRGLSFGPERTDYGPERADLGPRRADLRPYRWKDGEMDVWKFTPVSYRTLSLWGRCQKRKEEGGNGRKKSRKEREKEGR